MGSEAGPAELRARGLVERLRRRGIVAIDLGDVPVPRSDRDRRRPSPPSTIFRVARSVAARCRRALAQGMTPLVLGGDHSLVVGSITASAEQTTGLGVVWIDAHPDFNTPETTLTQNIHGMGLAVAAGLGFESLVRLRGFAPKVHPSRIAILGARAFDPGERLNLRRAGVRVWEAAETRWRDVPAIVTEAMAYLGGRGATAVHLSVDLDVLDPGCWPGVSTPAEGGWSAEELIVATHCVAAAAPLVAVDVVELTPPRDVNGATAEAAIRVAEEAFGIP